MTYKRKLDNLGKLYQQKKKYCSETLSRPEMEAAYFKAELKLKATSQNLFRYF